MTASWLNCLASLASGGIRKSHKTITYTYTIDTSRKARRCSSRSRLSSLSSAGTPSSRGSSSRSDSTRLPSEIRPGHHVVYVGRQKTRFIIPSGVLSHPCFKLLLEKVDKTVPTESHEFPGDLDDETGAIVLPFEADFLHRLLFLIDNNGEDGDQEDGWEEVKTFLRRETPQV